MIMKNKYSELPVEEQLRKRKKENRTLFISAIICTIVIVAVSIVFFVYELDKAIAIGFLALLPFSWWIGLRGSVLHIIITAEGYPPNLAFTKICRGFF